MFGLFVGASWLLGRTAGFGPQGAYAGVFLAYAWMAAVVIAGFRYSGWADRAAEMMAERGSGGESPPSASDGSPADDSGTDGPAADDPAADDPSDRLSE
jgi:hypothetical protein